VSGQLRVAQTARLQNCSCDRAERAKTGGPRWPAGPDPAVNFPFSYLSNSGTYRKVHGAIARETAHGTKDFCSIFWHPALKNTRENATSDFKASADITSTKKVRRLAAVLFPLPSSVFYPISAFPRQSRVHMGSSDGYPFTASH
jgi:hypothetical protein